MTTVNNPPTPVTDVPPPIGRQLGAFADRAELAIAEGYRFFTTRLLAVYGAAVLRIGYAGLYCIFLLHELPHRNELWGPSSPFTPAMDHTIANTAYPAWSGWVRDWYTLIATNSPTVFGLFYAFAIIVCAVFALGWQTRLFAVLFAIVVTSFNGRNIFVSDGSDNVLTLMSLYLVFIASGRVWSLDSRFRRRSAAKAAASGSDAADAEAPTRTVPPSLEQLGEVRRRLVVVMHNCAICVVGAQMFLIYGAAGLYKVQGSLWQNGTALYYALNINYFRPWAGLSNFMANHSLMVAFLCYSTIFIQASFFAAVWSKKLKYFYLISLLGMHFGIAVLMGLPIFSTAMMVGDAIFLPDKFWLWCGRQLRGIGARRRGQPALAIPAPAGVPLPESSLGLDSDSGSDSGADSGEAAEVETASGNGVGVASGGGSMKERGSDGDDD